MNPKIAIIEQYLSCTKCKGHLLYQHPVFICRQCERQYPFHNDCIIEMLPPAPIRYSFDTRSAYHEAIYHKLFYTSIENADPQKSWAAPGEVESKWEKKKREHVQFIRSLIKENVTQRDTYADFTGASGYYTFELAKEFKWIFHCDLSIESMLYGQRRAEKEKIDNIIFVRADYTQSPFVESLDLVYCGDTLIYSPYHEGLLLNGMKQALKPDGLALFDFHNWWHNPLRRMGLMSNTFGECYSYSEAQTKSYVEQHFPSYQYQGYYQEFTSGKKPAWMPAAFPNTRHTFVAKKVKP